MCSRNAPGHCDLSVRRRYFESPVGGELGGLDGWMQEALKAGGSDPGALEAGWLACWLEGLDWIRLDASGCWIGVGDGIG